MFKSVLYFIIAVLFASCAASYTMFNTYNSYYSKEQIDSICLAEKLPPIKVGDWHSMGYFDSEDSVTISQYFYIRNIKKSKEKNIEIAFVCTDFDTIYKMSKRVMIKEK